jgi:MFS family permease
VASGATGWAQLRDGWRVLFRNPFLLATTLLTLASVLVLTALQGIILPVHFTLIEAPGLLGFVLSALAAGMLAGGVVYAVLGSRGRRRTWFVIGLAATAVGFGVIAPLLSVWAIFAGAFVIGLASGMFGSLMGVLMIERIPEELRGRVMGTQTSMMMAAAPLGLVGAAIIIEVAGATAAAIVFAAVWVVVAIVGMAAKSLRDLEPAGAPTPQATTDPVVADAQR